MEKKFFEFKDFDKLRAALEKKFLNLGIYPRPTIIFLLSNFYFLLMDFLKIKERTIKEALTAESCVRDLKWLKESADSILYFGQRLEEPLNELIERLDDILNGEETEIEDADDPTKLSSEEKIEIDKEMQQAKTLKQKFQKLGVSNKIASLTAGKVSEISSECLKYLNQIDGLFKRKVDIDSLQTRLVEIQVGIYSHMIPNHLKDMNDDEESYYFPGLLSNLSNCLSELTEKLEKTKTKNISN